MPETKPIPYSEVKDKIRTGDLIAFTTTKYNSFLTFILFLYQRLLGATYTHVGIIVRTGNSTFVVEAVPPLVRIYPVENLSSFYWIDATVSAPNAKQLEFLMKRVGTPYSILDMFKGTIGMENNLNNYYCSELAADFYYNFGYIHDRSLGHTPDSIVKAIMERGNEKAIHVVVDRGNLT